MKGIGEILKKPLLAGKMKKALEGIKYGFEEKNGKYLFGGKNFDKLTIEEKNRVSSIVSGFDQQLNYKNDVTSKGKAVVVKQEKVKKDIEKGKVGGTSKGVLEPLVSTNGPYGSPLDGGDIASADGLLFPETVAGPTKSGLSINVVANPVKSAFDNLVEMTDKVITKVGDDFRNIEEKVESNEERMSKLKKEMEEIKKMKVEKDGMKWGKRVEDFKKYLSDSRAELERKEKDDLINQVGALGENLDSGKVDAVIDGRVESIGVIEDALAANDEIGRSEDVKEDLKEVLKEEPSDYSSDFVKFLRQVKKEYRSGSLSKDELKSKGFRDKLFSVIMKTRDALKGVQGKKNYGGYPSCSLQLQTKFNRLKSCGSVSTEFKEGFDNVLGNQSSGVAIQRKLKKLVKGKSDQQCLKAISNTFNRGLCFKNINDINKYKGFN